MKKRKPSKHFGFDQVYDNLNMNWIPVWSTGKDVNTPAGMPYEVTILGQRYRVRYRTEIFSAPKKSAALDGIVIFSNRLIMLDPLRSVHEMRETLYHEVCHVYIHEIQKKDCRLHKLTDAQVEGFCDLFGESVYDLACNNPLPTAR